LANSFLWLKLVGVNRITGNGEMASILVESGADVFKIQVLQGMKAYSLEN